MAAWARRGSALVALLVLSTAALAAGSTPAAAEPAPVPPSELPDEASALAAANRFGTRIEVAGRRSETGQLFANPDGTFTVEQHSAPVRVRRADGSWTAVDTTLRRAADGAPVPVATATDLRFSPGGSGPFARVAQGGKSLALALPWSLPAPVLDGAGATYREVLPGVDLIVTAQPAGFSQVLVVRTRQAAANPALSTLRFQVQATGLAVRSRAGGFVAVDAAGATVFTSPAPLMWDSAGDGAPRAINGAEPASAAGGLRRPDWPIEGDRTARMPVAVSKTPGGGTEVALVPDRALLDDPGTEFPVYLDPSVTAPRNEWAMISSGFPDQEYYNFADDEGVGLCDVQVVSSCNRDQIKRLAWEFGFSSTMHRTHILSATFRAWETHAYDCTADAVQLWRVGAISSATNWNNHASTWGRQLASVTIARKTGCPLGPGWVEFDATIGAAEAAANLWPSLTLGLRAGNEGSMPGGWKRFRNDATLSITYNTAPNTPDQLRTNGLGCTQGANRPWVGTLTPTMSARLTDADAGQVLNSKFYWAALGAPRSEADTVTQGSIANGGTTSRAIPAGELADGGTYYWQVIAGDGTDVSPLSPACELTVDATRPSAPPTIASADGLYPSDGQSHGEVGLAGTFTFTANGVTDVVAFEYGTVDPPTTVVAADTTGGSATISLVPSRPGQNTLYVRSKDRAGNKSDIATYLFLVNAASSPVGWWPLAEQSGTTAADYGSGGHPGSLVGGVGWTAGRTGESPWYGAAMFNGTGNIETAAPVVRTDASFTVAAWVRLTDTTAPRTAVSQDGNRLSGFYLQYLDGAWRFAMASGDVDAPAIARATAGDAPSVGLWTHLVGTYDRSAGQIRLYVNGIHAASAAFTAPWNAAGVLRIGRAKYAGAAVDWWKGDISDVRLWDRMLQPGEIMDLATDTQVSQIGLASATADSACTATETADKAIDGSVSGDSKWCSLGASKWLQMTLASPRTVTDVVIRHAQAGGESASWNTRDFDVQASTNGGTWTTVLEVRGNTLGVSRHRLAAPVRASQLKLVIVTPTQDGNTAARIYEVEAYGIDTTLTNIALGKPASSTATSCTTTETPSRAVDGVITGDIHSKWCTLDQLRRLVVDLGFDREVWWVTLRHAGAGGETAVWNTRDYLIQVSADGLDWVTVTDQRANTANSSGHLYTHPLVARYVGFVPQDPTQDSDPATRLFEFEIYSQ